MTGMDTKRYLSFYETGLGKQILKFEVGYLRKQLKGYEKILDIGCGPGIFERELKDLNITGIDSSPEMLKLAEEQSKAHFVLGSAEKLPFKKSSFDCAFFITSLEFIDDYKEALGEVDRILVKGGKILILMLNQKSQYFRGKASDGEYTKKIKHIEMSPKYVEDYLSKRFNVIGEYLMGVENDKIFLSNDSMQAAITHFSVPGLSKVFICTLFGFILSIAFFNICNSSLPSFNPGTMKISSQISPKNSFLRSTSPLIILSK